MVRYIRFLVMNLNSEVSLQQLADWKKCLDTVSFSGFFLSPDCRKKTLNCEVVGKHRETEWPHSSMLCFSAANYNIKRSKALRLAYRMQRESQKSDVGRRRATGRRANWAF